MIKRSLHSAYRQNVVCIKIYLDIWHLLSRLRWCITIHEANWQARCLGITTLVCFCTGLEPAHSRIDCAWNPRPRTWADQESCTMHALHAPPFPHQCATPLLIRVRPPGDLLYCLVFKILTLFFLKLSVLFSLQLYYEQRTDPLLQPYLNLNSNDNHNEFFPVSAEPRGVGTVDNFNPNPGG